MAKLWKKGRGKLGCFTPLLGSWISESTSPMGPVRCTRTFERVLGDNYLRLIARWEFGHVPKSKVYEEMAIIGVGDEGVISFWSFTSDGKKSTGVLADVTDLNPEAVGFEAKMPAGIARMAYWPEIGGRFRWVVESKTKKGWNRMVDHHYDPILPTFEKT